MSKFSSSETAVLWVTTLTSFLSPFLISSVNIALPIIQKEFSADAVLLSWVATSYILATSIFLLPIGKIADIYGRKKFFFLGLILFTLATTAMIWVPSIEVLIALRIVQGAAGAMLVTTGMAILTSAVPPSRRGRAIGYYVSAVYIGLAIGPFVGGQITHHFGWRWIFLGSTFLGLVCIVIALKGLKDEWTGPPGQRLDWIGTILYTLTLFSLVFGAGLVPQLKGVLFISGGFILLLVFIFFESRISQPILEVNLFRKNRLFAFSSLAALISYAATFSVTFLMSLYLQYVKAITPEAAGVILITQPAVQAAFSPITGRLSDKVEPLHLASAGMTITAIGLLLLSFLQAAASYYYIIIILLLLGFGFALFSSPNMNAIMGSVNKAHYGLASGTVSTMRLLGQMISMATATSMFALFIGREQISPKNYNSFLISFKYTFLIFFVWCVLGIFFSLMRGELRETKLEEIQ